MEKVSTTPSDRGRSISSLRVPYEGDKVELIIEDMVLVENVFVFHCRMSSVRNGVELQDRHYKIKFATE